MQAMNSATAANISMPLAGLAGGGPSLIPEMVERVEQQPSRIAGADEQAHVADAHGEERLQRRLCVGQFFPPVADEHERAEAHDLPAEDELHHVLGEHHGEHAGGEQGEAGEEVGVATVAAHVLGGVDLHERGDERDEQQQHDGEAVDVRTDGHVEVADAEPVQLLDRLDVVPFLGDFLGELAGEAPCPSNGVLPLGCRGVDPLDPLVGGAGGDDERAEHAGDADLAAAARHALAEPMMRKNATAGMSGISHACSRNQPDADAAVLLQRTRVSPSFPTGRRARWSCGCGR
jgi:hypothetical protein